MEENQQGGDGSRKEMDSVSGWGKAEDGDNARLRKRRKQGYFDRDRSGHGTRLKRNKKKTLRHIIMKYIHEVRMHIQYCASDLEWRKRIIKEYGSIEAYERKYSHHGWRHYRWRWSQDAIKKIRLQLIAAGGDPNYRRLLDL